MSKPIHPTKEVLQFVHLQAIYGGLQLMEEQVVSESYPWHCCSHKLFNFGRSNTMVHLHARAIRLFFVLSYILSIAHIYFASVYAALAYWSEREVKK
jgi:hypothetical protein